MGNWNINIQGTGAHHNKDYDKDANKMAKNFVDDLKAAGHHIEGATFTHGSKEDIMPTVAETPPAEGESK